MKKCVKCLTIKPYEEFYIKSRKHGTRSVWCKTCMCSFQRARWKDRKIQAINLLGGQCTLCGYKRNAAAMDFHHVDPERKNGVWHEIKKLPWDQIIAELKLCQLLCKNCHSELHFPGCSLDGSQPKLHAINHMKALVATGVCPVCSKDCFGTTFCSTQCSQFARRKVPRPTKKQLTADLKKLSYVAAGKKYGVSDSAVRKWARGYKIMA